MILRIFTIILVFASYLYAQPQFRLDKPYWNFGRAIEGAIPKEQIIVKNTGTEKLIARVRSSCECILIDKSKLTIAPSEEEKLYLTFNTKSYSGKKTEYVFFDTNDPEVEHLTWLVEGEILPGKKPPPRTYLQQQGSPVSPISPPIAEYLLAQSTPTPTTTIKLFLLLGVSRV
ncbi:MAG: DUF1573 domain-containing protein [Elusimicrobiota bacterium]|nr:DUF1573 domain-containing protein [Elusimicrobiota bacterium]